MPSSQFSNTFAGQSQSLYGNDALLVCPSTRTVQVCALFVSDNAFTSICKQLYIQSYFTVYWSYFPIINYHHVLFIQKIKEILIFLLFPFLFFKKYLKSPGYFNIYRLEGDSSGRCDKIYFL
jgi:hypothetical protein